MIRPSEYPLSLRILVVVTLLLFAVNAIFFIGPLVAFTTAIGAKEVGTGIATLFATFIGAWFAFHFSALQRVRERIATEIAAGNRALFTLTTMWNETIQFQKEVVDPHRGKPDAWFNLHVGRPLNPTLSFDMRDLSFLLQAAAQVFQNLFLEEERFRLAAFIVEEHRSLAFTIVWPRLEAAGVKLGEQRPEHEITGIIGVAAAQRLRVITAAIITNFDENAKSLEKAFIDLRDALKQIYPEAKFINFKFETLAENKASGQAV